MVVSESEEVVFGFTSTHMITLNFVLLPSLFFKCGFELLQYAFQNGRGCIDPIIHKRDTNDQRPPLKPSFNRLIHFPSFTFYLRARDNPFSLLQSSKQNFRPELLIPFGWGEYLPSISASVPSA
ncbi:hypothetical protein S83_006131 [Arachis hypogaea]|nr:uncharacterized protein DS421_3g63560 [Arachis hypogaea]